MMPPVKVWKGPLQRPGVSRTGGGLAEIVFVGETLPRKQQVNPCRLDVYAEQTQQDQPTPALENLPRKESQVFDGF